jgi:hypothetical protein
MFESSPPSLLPLAAVLPAFINNITAKTVNGSPPTKPVIAGPSSVLYQLFAKQSGSPAPAFIAERIMAAGIALSSLMDM